jgi:hypothetical protein
MKVFKGKQFGRWASSEGISDSDLCVAAKEAFAGQIEADLGGYLFKKRIARSGGGKSGGYRTILGFRKSNADRIFFLHGFPKNARANISSKEQEALSTVAGGLVDASDEQIVALKGRGSILELECGQ